MARRQHRGLALIAVLWLTALLTVLATAALTVSVTQRRTAETYLESVHADDIADSAMRLALLSLLAPPEGGRGAASLLGQAQAISVFGASVGVVVEPEAGRVDLNTADPDLLFALFAANGWPENDAHSMVARILDWRDADDEARAGGAESREYRAANLPYGPRNGPFESVEEIRQVLGGDRVDREIIDSLTVFTHSQGCSVGAATPAVARALTWADARHLGGHGWLTGTFPPVAAVIGSSDTGLAGDVVRVRACVASKHSERCRVAVVRLTGGLSKPFQVFVWQDVRGSNMIQSQK